MLGTEVLDLKTDRWWYGLLSLLTKFHAFIRGKLKFNDNNTPEKVKLKH